MTADLLAAKVYSVEQRLAALIATGSTGGTILPLGIVPLKPSGDTNGKADYAALRSAMASASAAGGGFVVVQPGSWWFSAPVMIPPGVLVICLGWPYALPVAGAVFRAGSAFTQGGAPVLAIVVFADQATAGWAGENNNAGLYGIAVDGSTAPAGCRCLALYGTVQNPWLEKVHFAKAPGRGVEYLSDAGGWPGGVHMLDWKIQQCGQEGFYAPGGMNDCWLTRGHVTGNGTSGTYSGMVYTAGGNQSIIQCRFEWSSKRGLEITNNSSRAGGIHHIGCSTDRNTQDGVLVTGTGTAPLVLSGCFLRRDGRNGNAGGGGYAGLRVDTATCPVLFTGSTIGTGVDDDGSGTESPQYGLVTNAAAEVRLGGYIRGVTKSMLLDAASNVYVDDNLSAYHGTGAAPVAEAPAIAALAAAGVGATVTGFVGDDYHGRFTLNPAGTPAAGAQASVTFSVPRAQNPKAILIEAYDTTVSGVPAAAYTGLGLTGFNITCPAALTAAHAVRFSYHVIG